MDTHDQTQVMGRSDHKTKGVSINWILMGGIGGIVAISLLATFWLGFSVAAENTTALLRQRALGMIDEITDKVQRHLRPAAENSRFTAAHYAKLGRMPDGTDVGFLRNAMVLVPQVRYSAFVAENGDAFLYSREGESRLDNWRDDPNVMRVLGAHKETSDIQWQDPVFSETLKRTIIPATVAVRRDGAYLGYAGTAVSIRELSLFVESLKVAGGAAFILSGRTHVIAHPFFAHGLLDGAFSPKTLFLISPRPTIRS